MSTHPRPPLLGDANGCYRIHITGNSGTGKSTLAAHLSDILGIPHISLDKLFWQPGWTSTPTDQFRAKIREAMGANPKGWIVDGDYTLRTSGLVDENATDVVWLDIPLVVYFPRIIWRTFLRILGLRPPCSPGCPESIREVFFSQDSILVWCLTHHWESRRRGQARMEELGDRMVCLGGSGSVDAWVERVAYMAKQT